MCTDVMRLLSGVAALVVAAACGAGVPPASPSASERGAAADATSSPRPDRNSLTEAAAIRLARDSEFGFADLFVDSPARVDCVIKGGGPAPGIRVPGSCATSASREGSTGAVIVTFTEYWDGRSFHYAGEPGVGELSHLWVFAVNPAGRVTVLANSGNFPPQQVR